MEDVIKIDLNDPEMKELLDSFLIETKEILENLNVDLVEIEKNPNDAELLNKVFRSFHTIKGTSGFFGLEKLTAVTHKCEDILNKLRKGEASLTSDLMDVILVAYDKIKELITNIEIHQNEDVDVDECIESLVEEFEKLNGNINVEDKPKKTTKKKTKETPPVKSENEETQNKEPASVKKADNSIRVDVDRLDELLNIASELVLGRNRLAQVSSEFALHNEGSKYARELLDTSKHIDLMTNELQTVVMKTRMVKIGKVFNRFPRVIRDLSKDAKKKVKLEISGEETELDKTIVEEIYDPLVHLIRNAIDHGIETPQDRKKAGKDETGTINLSAEQEGNNILIKIEDDGKGLDIDLIAQKAVDKNLIPKEKVKELSKQDIYNLIFLPGFSTAEKVTNISGRGVGMDVVKTNVNKLRGMINIDSNPGVGTSFIIKLPLTLAIITGMIVRVMKEKLVIPLSSVIEVVRVHRESIKTINGKEVINIRDNIIPIISISKILFKQEEMNEDRIWNYVVIVGVAEKKIGIMVDELIEQKEIVIKPLGELLNNNAGIAGSTIMGDGTVVMIIDLIDLIPKIDY